MDLDVVSRAIRFAERQEIAPRFGRLRSGDIEEKSPGEVVTAADRACEALLTLLLRDIRDVPVVGEEAASADPGLFGVIDTAPEAWVVDPLDGTTNFATGSPDYAVMVAHVRHGLAVASWIWIPAVGQMCVAERGAGSYTNGARVQGEPLASLQQLHGVVKHRFLPDDVAERVVANEHRFAAHLPGIEYPTLVAGDVDFLLYWRTLPWDHAPGVLFAEEAGFRAARPDGTAYRCGDGRHGLVVAHRDVCDDVRIALLG